MRELILRNEQRTRKLNIKFLRGVTLFLLEEALALRRWELAVHFISSAEMARVNKQFLDHEGSTDVITFDFRDGYEDADFRQCDLAGEIYISVADALKQAEEFSARWTEELVRYGVHGVLHLRGYDDLTPGERKVMKREENRLVKLLARRFPLEQVARD